MVKNVDSGPDFTLLDLIDAHTLQNIQDAFAKATGMAALTVDLNGPVTTLSNATDFCIKLTRNSKLGFERCNKCDIESSKKAAQTGKYTTYFCHAGLVDFGAPIVVNGKQIGGMLGGQVLTDAPDIDKFRKIAQELGINPDEYEKAVKKVKIVPKSSIDASAELLYIVANTLSKSAHDRLMTKINSENVLESVNKLIKSIEIISNLIEKNTKNISSIEGSIDEIYSISQNEGEQVKKTKSIIKEMKDIALQINLLGFNAFVEATRAKEAGVGFQVIAQEIRKMGEIYKNSATLIEDVLTQIGSYSKQLDVSADVNKEIVTSSMKTSREIKALLEELMETTTRLIRN